jgi:hypothetical protein
MHQQRLVSALQRYFACRDEPADALALESARRAVLRTIPQVGKWFFCEVDGQDYAVRVSKASRIEIMRNIFNPCRVESRPQPSARA